VNSRSPSQGKTPISAASPLAVRIQNAFARLPAIFAIATAKEAGPPGYAIARRPSSWRAARFKIRPSVRPPETKIV
jgi:hypothetical protein